MKKILPWPGRSEKPIRFELPADEGTLAMYAFVHGLMDAIQLWVKPHERTEQAMRSRLAWLMDLEVCTVPDPDDGTICTNDPQRYEAIFTVGYLPARWGMQKRLSDDWQLAVHLGQMNQDELLRLAVSYIDAHRELLTTLDSTWTLELPLPLIEEDE